MTTDTFDVADTIFRRGDALCDAHLSLLLVRYKAAVEGLEGLNGAYDLSYALVLRDLRCNLDRLEMLKEKT